MLESLSTWLVNFVHNFGYGGIFLMTFLESTFVPIPSEVTMIPAGYLAHHGEMNFLLIMLASVSGTLSGSLANYWIAYHFGRRFLYRYGKYMLFDHENMERLDKYFKAHGEISTFTGRLIPGLRHFISFPAGLAHMHIRKFCLYTGAGGTLWMFVLVMVGYLIGGNKALVKHYMPIITYFVLSSLALMVLLYIRRHKKKTIILANEALAKEQKTDGMAG